MAANQDTTQDAPKRCLCGNGHCIKNAPEKRRSKIKRSSVIKFRDRAYIIPSE